jgi:hypothetical protein
MNMAPRYFSVILSRPKSVDLDNYGAGKGLELIPTSDTELILGVPAYETRKTPKGTQSGWADETFLLKYRAVSANEESGNYIVTGFLGVSVPTGVTRSPIITRSSRRRSRLEKAGEAGTLASTSNRRWGSRFRPLKKLRSACQ